MNFLVRSRSIYIIIFSFCNISTAQEAVNNIREPEVVIPDENNVKNKYNLPDSYYKEDKIVLTPSYLRTHPEELENLLVTLLQSGNVEGLKLLLPIYSQVANRDDSLIEWGTAIILSQEGKFNESVRIYRKLISYFPDLKIIRFQLAVALFYDKQFIAARNEFEKLRADAGNERAVIDQYLSVIDKENSWNFNGSVSYLHDDNINNTVKSGTKLTLPNGATITSTTERESAKGFNFSLSADKRFSLKDNFYLSAAVSTDGHYYWDNKKYNDFSIRLSPSLGYSNAYTDVSLSPFIRNQWYGGGKNSETSALKSYILTRGLRINAKQWLSPKWRYQGALELSRDKYAVNYNHLDGNNYLLSNTITYVPNQENYFYGGIDFNKKSTKLESNSYNRLGARIGWGHEWNRGISTSLSAGYAKKSYDGVDFFDIKQKNNEYNMNISIWNRGFHIWDITPRLVWSYNKVDSNHPLYSIDNNKIYLDFSKTF